MKDFAPRTPAAKAAKAATGKGLVLIDNRASTVAQRKTQVAMAASPWQVAQRPPAPVQLARAAAPTLDLAAKTKEELIQPYIDLIPHLAGECEDIKKGAELKGGHLHLAMKAKWKNHLEIKAKDTMPAAHEAFNAQWVLVKNPEALKEEEKIKTKSKDSTMFPLSWTVDDLKGELKGASSVKGGLCLKSGIVVARKTGTFYPIIAEKKRKNK